MSDIQNTLQERGKNYGPFTGHAGITQAIKSAMCKAPNWIDITPDKKEALEMIAHKIGRILNGNSNYDDSWVDIAGYAQLIVNNIQGKPV